jgi:histidinol dehydrogenase
MPLSIYSYEQYRQANAVNTPVFPAEKRSQVLEIIDTVRRKGDSALFDYTKQFDGAVLDELKISAAELKAACLEVDSGLLAVIRQAAANIEKFHRRQLREEWWEEESGLLVGQRYLPLQSVGAYVPGGTAAYPSSVLMTVIPARVAGVKEIIVCTPPDKNGRVNPLTLAAASEVGATAVYRVGGAQAIAAMAYGTETIPQVQKIVGPGNIYVTLAKKELYGQVGIDMLAGPSEIVIVADHQAKPSFIAADLLSQAEHDPFSKPILITISEELANLVLNEIEEQLLTLPRREIADASLTNQGAIILVAALEDVWPVVNDLAPEHLELQIKEAWRYLDQVTSAGAVFVGPYTPEPLGDYWAGTNHVLPTGLAARYASALGTDDFIRRSHVIYCRAKTLQLSAEKIAVLARAEGLEAHARSVLIRGKSDESLLQD